MSEKNSIPTNDVKKIFIEFATENIQKVKFQKAGRASQSSVLLPNFHIRFASFPLLSLLPFHIFYSLPLSTHSSLHFLDFLSLSLIQKPNSNPGFIRSNLLSNWIGSVFFYPGSNPIPSPFLFFSIFQIWVFLFDLQVFGQTRKKPQVFCFFHQIYHVILGLSCHWAHLELTRKQRICVLKLWFGHGETHWDRS